MPNGLIGQTLGQYEIRSLLGKGGMSTVYLAYQPAMDRLVAVKVLPRAFLHDDTFLTRFQREVRTIARLEHLHILPVYDVGEDQGVPYLVMRYQPGGTLADLIADRLPPLQTVVRVVQQVAGALDYAHERGIVHRDLKPSNILLDSAGNAYLADFGIAHVREAASVTTDSRVIGTPPYIAPEMVRKGETVTHAVDIYALGIITYEMMTGEPPYREDDPMQTLMAHVLEPVPSVRSFDPNVAVAVDEVVRQCLAKTPGERYETAGLYASEFTRAAETGYRTVQSQPVPAAPPQQQAALAGPPLPPRSATAAQAYPPGEIDTTEDEAGPILPWGCVAVVGALLALLAGAVMAASAITGGDPLSVLALLTPAPTFTITPTVTLTPSGDATDAAPAETPTPTIAFAATPILPPPASGGRLVFASNRDGDYEIYLIDSDGSNLTQLTDNTVFDFDPAWAPDGNRIVYASRADGDPEIMVMDATGENPRQLTDNAARDADPAWSPDGEWIVFASDRAGSFDLWLMAADGSAPRRLTADDEQDELDPAWSPDGTRIAYYGRQGTRESSAELWVVTVATGAVTRLTDNTLLDQWPDWSPDGSKILFTSAQGAAGDRRALLAYSVADGQITRLTDPDARDDDGAWSPDGTAVAFDSDRDGDGVFDLYVLDLVSGELRKLTSSGRNDVTPDWQPQR